MTKRQPVRYAHPLDVPEGQGWYVPGQVGEMVNAPVPEGQPRPKKPKKIPHPTQGYEPGGLRIGGTFYLGGEALSHHDLQELAEAGILDEVLPYLHSDRESALNDYSGERAAPGKDELARRAGRDLAPGEQLPRPERRQVSGKPLGANQRPGTPDEGLSNLPGGAARWKGIVSDEEAANLSPAQAEKFVDLWNELPASDDYAAGARLGLAKRGWYEDAAKTILAMFGDDAPRFTALLAATSPVKSVQQNLQNALITWDLYARKRAELGREMSKGEMRQWLAGDYLAEVRDAGGYSISGEDANIARALLKGEVGQPGTLSGPKVDSFARNLLGRLHAVTNDTWMAAFGGVQQKRLSGVNRPDDFGPTRDVYGGGYAAAAAKAREAAQILNQRLGEGEAPWQPANVQETTWSVQRSLGDTMGGSRYLQRTAGRGRPLDLRARDIPDPDQTLYGLTNAKVHGNADFATLLAEALGDEGDATGQALRRLFERHPEMAKAYDLREKENRKVQAGRISQLPPRAMQNLLPGQLPAALRVGRRAGESSGRFDNSVVQESRRGQRVRYAERYRTHDLPVDVQEMLLNLINRGGGETSELALRAVTGDTSALYLLHDRLLDEGQQKQADSLRPHMSRLHQRDEQLKTPAGSPLYDVGRTRRNNRVVGQALQAKVDPKEAWRLGDDFSIGEHMTDRPKPTQYMARPSHVPQPPANASYLPFASDQNPSEFYNAVMALGPEASQLLQRYLLADPNEDALLDLVDYLDSLDQAGNAQAGDLAAEVKVGLGNDMTQRVPAHRWEDHSRSVATRNHDPETATQDRYADQWVQPREAAVREARRRRLEQQYQQHPHPEAQQLGHEAFTDEAEDPASFDILGDWHEDQGETQQANLVRSLRPRVRKSKRASLRHRRVEKYSDAMVASSNNTEENLSFDEAFARVQSGDQKVFKDIADQMTKSMGLQGTSYSAIGDWEDGAEHSLLTQIPGQADMDTLRYVGAWQGLTGNQRSVLVFRPDHGGHDSVYQIQVPETDAAKVRAQLSKFGVPFRTIIPGKQGTKVVIYDQKRQLRDNVTQFAGMYNAPVRESIGSGEYVGGSSRSEARAAYRKVIADYEAKTGRRPQGAGPSPGPQAGGPVHPQQTGQPRGRRGTQGAEAAQGRGGRGA